MKKSTSTTKNRFGVGMDDHAALRSYLAHLTSSACRFLAISRPPGKSIGPITVCARSSRRVAVENAPWHGAEVPISKRVRSQRTDERERLAKASKIGFRGCRTVSTASRNLLSRSAGEAASMPSISYCSSAARRDSSTLSLWIVSRADSAALDCSEHLL